MQLSIIIVNYNVKEFLQNLIPSIRKAATGISYEILIVDNASSDDSVEFLRQNHPEITLIANEKNKGFGKANNQALEIAKGEFLLLLNPDTIVSEDTFTTMFEFFKTHPDAGMAGCKILNPDGTLQLACRRSFPGPWTSFTKVSGLSSLFPKSRLFARYNLTYLDENQSYEVDAISGSFMMLRKEVYTKIGGFDEDFFMYGEDLDLCYRVQKSGYKVYYVHSTQIIHYKGESTKRSSLDETKFFYNAMHLFVKKHLSSSLLVEFILRSAILISRIFAFLAKRKFVLISILFDFIFFNLTILISEKIYHNVKEWSGFHKESLIFIYTIPAALHIITASILRVYKKDSLSVLRNFSAILISFFLMSSLTFFFKEFAYSRVVVLLNYFLLFFTLTFWRILVKVFFNVGDKKGFLSKKTLVVGINSISIQTAQKLSLNTNEIHNVLGLISLNTVDIGKKIEGLEVIGSIENLNKVIREHGVDEVVFPSEEISYNKTLQIISNVKEENVEFKIINNNLDYLVGKTSVSLLNELPVISINYNINRQPQKSIKRFFDIVLSAKLMLFVYLPLKLSKKDTPFKRFISRMPEVFNGKLSFVGPKEEYQDIYLGKKGLTGYWFIEEGSNTERLDIYYAKNQNLWLDLEILGRTLNKMLFHK